MKYLHIHYYYHQPLVDDSVPPPPSILSKEAIPRHRPHTQDLTHDQHKYPFHFAPTAPADNTPSASLSLTDALAAPTFTLTSLSLDLCNYGTTVTTVPRFSGHRNGAPAINDCTSRISTVCGVHSASVRQSLSQNTDERPLTTRHSASGPEPAAEHSECRTDETRFWYYVKPT